MGLGGKRLGKCVIAGAKRNAHAIGWQNETRGVKSFDNGGRKPNKAVGGKNPEHGMTFGDRRLHEVIGRYTSNGDSMRLDTGIYEKNPDHGMTFDDGRLNEVIGTCNEDSMRLDAGI